MSKKTWGKVEEATVSAPVVPAPVVPAAMVPPAPVAPPVLPQINNEPDAPPVLPQINNEPDYPQLVAMNRDGMRNMVHPAEVDNYAEYGWVEEQ